MRFLRSFSLVAPILLGACSFINAPGEIDTGTGGGGAGGTTGGGGTTTSGDECGDGKITGAEKCDDDNVVPGDGCSATCTIEAGFTCTGEPSDCKNLCGNGKKDGNEICDDGNTISGDDCDENCTPTGCGNGIVTGAEKCDDGNLVDGDDCDSNCTPTGCGNGVVTAGEQCDDGGTTDGDMTNGDQDPCSPVCKFKEFDVEASQTAGGDAQNPEATLRRVTLGGADTNTFSVYWYVPKDAKIIGRNYKFDGLYVTDDTTSDVTTSPSPDPRGEAVCTASTNRTLFFWNDVASNKAFGRKIEANGMLNPSADTLPFANPQPRLSCAAAPDPANTFLVTTYNKQAGQTGYDVLVQNYSAIALSVGMPINVGLAAEPTTTATIPLSAGYLVAWSPDPANNAKIKSQQLDAMGQPLAGFVFTITDANDPNAKDLVGQRLGPQDQFVFGYTRDSVPDANNVTHREVAIRVHTSPGNSMDPIVPATDPAPQGEPRIVVNPANRKFMVLWTSGPMAAENVYYRLFQPNGTPLGEAVQANEGIIGRQTAPTAVVDPKTGDVAVIWDNQTTGKPHRITAKIFPALLN